jgi:hypothetical protein
VFDDNARHIAAWNGGHSPVFEPGLSELVADVKGESTDALVGVCVLCVCMSRFVGGFVWICVWRVSRVYASARTTFVCARART